MHDSKVHLLFPKDTVISLDLDYLKSGAKKQFFRELDKESIPYAIDEDEVIHFQMTKIARNNSNRSYLLIKILDQYSRLERIIELNVNT